jgi:hypothetical protein
MRWMELNSQTSQPNRLTRGERVLGARMGGYVGHKPGLQTG